MRHRRSQHREEPGREEGTSWSGFVTQSVRGNTPESTAPDGRVTFRTSEPSATRRVPAGSSSSELPSAQALPISEESSVDLPASESQISRQGDGRESKDKNQSGRAGGVPATSGKALTFKPPLSASGVPGANSNTILSRDFGQMFPSSECIMLGSGGRSESVGVQTSDSLLYSGKSSKKRNDSMSISTSDKDSTAESMKNKKTQNRGKHASESNGDDDAKKHLGKSGHKRTSSKRRPSSSRRHFQEETTKHNEVHKEKESIKERSKNGEAKSKALKEASNNNEKIIDKSSKREIVKNKYFPQKGLKLVHKSGRKGTAGSEHRTPVPSDQDCGLEERELLSRPTSESEDRTITSSSSSHSVQSIGHMSSEQGRMPSDKGELTEDEVRRNQCSEGDNSTEFSKELEHHSQPDSLSSTNEDSTNQSHQSPARMQHIASHGQSNMEEGAQGLKGGCEDYLIPKAPTLLLISPPEQNGESKQNSRSAGNGLSKHKSSNAIIPSQKTRRENLKNKSKSAQQCSQKERQSVIAIQDHPDSQREELLKSGTLRVAWIEDKERESAPQKKPPVRFEVNFSNQNSSPRKSKFPSTTTTTTMQEELTHGTTAISLQVKTNTIFCFINFHSF